MQLYNEETLLNGCEFRVANTHCAISSASMASDLIQYSQRSWPMIISSYMESSHRLHPDIANVELDRRRGKSDVQVKRRLPHVTKTTHSPILCLGWHVRISRDQRHLGNSPSPFATIHAFLILYKTACNNLALSMLCHY